MVHLREGTVRRAPASCGFLGGSSGRWDNVRLQVNPSVTTEGVVAGVVLQALRARIS